MTAHTLGSSAVPRRLHPVAWWVWALGLAATASRTTNPVLLLSIIAVASLVVAARRDDGPWGRAFRGFLLLGLVVLSVRVGFEVLFGAPQPGPVAFALPEVTLPDWMAGVRLGGDVTVPALGGAVCEGLQLVAILACVGAANALVEPSRLLKVVPAALYEVGVAVVVALSVAPQSVAHSRRVREARRLRGRRDSGWRAVAGSALPVLQSALDRSLTLAAAMDSRGFGRVRHVPARERRTTAALVLVGLLGACVGGYSLLDAGTPGWQGWVVLAVGTCVAVLGIRRSGRRSVRTVYRPDPWLAPEWLTSGVGMLAAAVTVLVTTTAGGVGSGVVADPTRWPALPWLPWLAVLAAAAPAVLTPRVTSDHPTAEVGAPQASHVRARLRAGAQPRDEVAA